MKQKSKFRRFWNLDHRKSDGFTLIELIVVIAIMAILAGVGTAGYGAYIESANKGADRKLVGDVMRAIQTSGNSYMADFTVDGQFTNGIQLPVGYVVLTTDGIDVGDSEVINKALVDAFGTNYATTMKLKYTGWEAGTIGGSNLHNAASGMLGKINKTAELMVTIQGLNISSLKLTEGTYESAGDMIVAVSGNVADFDGDGVITAADKTKFIEQWNNESTTAYDQAGFGLSGRENYSAVRMAYNNSFAEYVRTNYSGDKDADTLADGIAGYGQSAGKLANEKAGGGITGWLAEKAVNAVAKDTNFPYIANSKAFEDPDYIGYGDEELEKLYNEWLAGPAQDDAALFYDMMVTSATDGADYVEEHGADDFVDWFADQAQAYSDNLNEVQDKVDGESAIAIVAYYNGLTMDFDVYSAEADPRNEK